MENVNGNYSVRNVNINRQKAIPAKVKQVTVQEAPAPSAKASAKNVAAYSQSIKVPSIDKVFDAKMKNAATLPNGGYVFRNEVIGGKAIVKNNPDGSYKVSLIRDLCSTPEEELTLSREEFFMNPDLCSGFVIPKNDGTYDVTLLNPTNAEEKKLFGITNNMNKAELMKFMKERHFN